MATSTSFIYTLKSSFLLPALSSFSSSRYDGWGFRIY